jgi:hypothetical protein
MTRLTLHALNAGKTLGPFLAPALEAAARVETLAGKVLNLPQTDIVLRARGPRDVLSDGFSGYCPGAAEVWIDIDTRRSDLDFGPRGGFERTLVHELHHSVRWTDPGYGQTLGEAIVSEGLAGHFVSQVLGTAPEPWEHQFDGDTLTGYTQRAIEDWSDRGYDHHTWFFGGDGAARWIGYALGYEIVGRYLDAVGSRSPARLVHAPARDFRTTAEELALAFTL